MSTAIQNKVKGKPERRKTTTTSYYCFRSNHNGAWREVSRRKRRLDEEVEANEEYLRKGRKKEVGKTNRGEEMKKEMR